MAIILAGRFDSPHRVRAVLRDLGAAHFGRKEFAGYYVNPPGQQGLIPLPVNRTAGSHASSQPTPRAFATHEAGGMNAYLGSLLEALNQADGTQLPEAPLEAGAGPLVAICVDRPGTEQIARATLHRHGAQAIERTEGCWEDGDWKDFDACAAGHAMAGQA
jgi:hypothetical protein